MSVASITVSTATEPGPGNEENGDTAGFREDDGVVAIADGMGGRAGGADASRCAMRVFLRGVAELDPSERLDETQLREAVLRSHERVKELGVENPKLAGLGTTLTGLVFQGDRGKIVHVGDTRAYRHRDGELRQLTVDHTLVAELVARRHVDADQAGDYPMRHVLTNVLGGEQEPRVDVSDVSLRPSDVLLLVTDGFWESLGEDLMAGTLNEADEQADASMLCGMLMGAAKEIRGSDDRTVAVVHVAPTEERNPS